MIELHTANGAWLQSDDARLKSPKHRPMPTPLTQREAWEQKPESEKYDRMTLEEAKAFLGW